MEEHDMKKNIILIIATALAVAACDLDKFPLASLSPDSYFSTASEMDAFANNFYPDLPGTSVYEEESDMIIKMGLTNEMPVPFPDPEAAGAGPLFVNITP